MAQPADTFDTYDAVGNREDLSNIISNISPTTRPFMSAIRKGTATATNHEWQTDSLSPAADNARIEGDNATTTASTPTVRLGNQTQIADKVPMVTGTQSKVDSAGRSDEMTYQVMKKGKELLNDVERALLLNNAKVVGSSTVARELAGVPAWLATNTSFGATGADPTGDGTDARTDGTQRAFDEAFLKSVLSSCYDEGGEPNMIMVGSFNKQAMSGIVAPAQRQIGNDSRLNTALSVYVSDFGDLTVVPNRFSRPRDMLVLDTDLFELSELRPLSETPLAKQGDNDRVQLLWEGTLKSTNEAGSGIVADLTTA